VLLERQHVGMAQAPRARFEKLRERPWLSLDTAATLTGAPRRQILDAAHRGDIVQRHDLAPGTPSLDRDSVLAWAKRWCEVQAEEEAAARRRLRERQAKRVKDGPPQDGQVWLPASTAALVLGVSRVRVRQLAERDKLPCTVVGSRRWFRRDLLEQTAAA
jgi:hypothetical protein